MTLFNTVDTETEEAFACPTTGMRFTEMFNFWMYVVEVNPSGVIVTREGTSTFPAGAERHIYHTEDEFRAKFAYGTIPGYWVHFVDENNDVKGWANEPPFEGLSREDYLSGL